jgi:hypothetical protein
MEHRREPRFAADQIVLVTILGDPEIHHTGTVKNASGRGLGLEMAFPVGIGAALKLELPDSVLLGEAMYCRGQNGCYFVGIELQQAVHGIEGLSQMLRAIEDDCSGLERAYSGDERGCQAEQQSENQENRGALRQVSPHQVAMNYPHHR